MDDKEDKKLLKLKDLVINSEQNFLIVEDEDHIREIIAFYLEELGFTGKVLQADSIQEAKRHLNHERIDYICCDKNLPDGNGDALLKAIRKSPKFCDIPVLMVTAHTDVDNMLLSSRLGSSDYLTKPFTLKQFEDKLADGLKTHILPTKDKIHELKVKIIALEEEVEDLKEELKKLKA